MTCGMTWASERPSACLRERVLQNRQPLHSSVALKA
jgi:hypothetical protein